MYYEILLNKFLIKVSKNKQIIKGGVLQRLLKTSHYFFAFLDCEQSLIFLCKITARET